MRTGLLITGVLLLLVGFVWMGQGANLIGGSFMTGQTMWLDIGIGLALLGASLVWWSGVGRRRSR
jgi:hypothetical protein